MRLSTKGRYAVMAMTDLAGRQGADEQLRAVSLAEIATRQEISLSYLEQLCPPSQERPGAERARPRRRLSPDQGRA